ncbi:hypothetical protein A3F36_03490 [Candidatus Peribacteria bacterium RIFCSPHIGHO2_12_FULL_55_11]|nr:MAG: hypothetical protein A3F36_03490 [Candidatus Peribacteria bacterium RIFCSPHIGHO2_12_FULL_55_11]
MTKFEEKFPDVLGVDHTDVAPSPRDLLQEKGVLIDPNMPADSVYFTHALALTLDHERAMAEDSMKPTLLQNAQEEDPDFDHTRQSQA